MNRICIAALMTVMICASGCGPSATEKLLYVCMGNNDLEDSGADSIRLLISKGADVNAKDKNGYTPLILAAVVSSPEYIRLLIL